MDTGIKHGARSALAVIIALGLGGLPGDSIAEDETNNGAAIATTGNPDDHVAHSGNPDDREAESSDPEDNVVESGKLEDHEARSGNPAAMVTEAGSLESHETGSENLTHLGTSRPDAGFKEIEVPGQSEWSPTTDPQTLRARQNLVRAQKEARKARTQYGNMMERDYPRGAARIRIVEERDAAMKALEEAKQQLAEVE